MAAIAINVIQHGGINLVQVIQINKTERKNGLRTPEQNGGGVLAKNTHSKMDRKAD